VAYFGANIDSLEQNEKFAKSLQLDFPLLADPDKTAAKAYGVLAGGGTYTARHTIYISADGKILEVDSKVNPKTAGTDIAAKLEKFGVAKRESD